MDNIRTGDKQCVHCREVVHFLQCPLLGLPLYTVITYYSKCGQYIR